MLKLKSKLVGEYTKNGKTQYVFTLSGTPEAIAQFVKDQANVVKADGSKGASFHESGAPLFWNKSIISEISRSEKAGAWFAERGDMKAITAQAEALRSTNPTLADFMLKAQAEEMIAEIKQARLGLRTAPVAVETPATGDLSKA